MQAELLCMAIVANAPISKAPSIGRIGIMPFTGWQFTICRVLTNGSYFDRACSSLLMVSIPRNRKPSPRMVSLQLEILRFGMKLKIMPIMIDGMISQFRSNATSWAVTVVPMWEPRIRPIAWTRVSKPALTKPTTMTVLAPEDWMTPVTTAPVATATKRLAENILKMERIRSPATLRNPSLISFMPKIKIANPPITWTAFIKVIRSVSLCV